MSDKKDISDLEDIKLMVNTFYSKVRQDELLAPIFNGIIKDQWNTHLEKMYRFWETVLLQNHTYYGSPFRPHAKLPVGKEHFERWKKLFNDSLDENFVGSTTEEARWRAEKMAEMFLMKINYFKDKSSGPLL